MDTKQRVHIVLTKKALDLMEKVKAGNAETYDEQKIANQLFNIERRPDRARDEMLGACRPSSIGYYNWLQREGYVTVESSPVLDFLEDKLPPVKKQTYHLGDTCPEQYALTEKGRVLVNMYPLLIPETGMVLPKEIFDRLPNKEVTLGYYLTNYIKAEGQVLPWVLDRLVQEGLLTKDEDEDEEPLRLEDLL